MSTLQIQIKSHCMGKRSLITLIIYFLIITCIVLLAFTQLFKYVSPNISVRREVGPIVLPLMSADDFHYVEPRDSFFKYKHNKLGLKADWHNRTLMQLERHRHGPGEHGLPYSLDDADDIELNNKLKKDTGYFSVVSDKISVHRAIPDIRHEDCNKKLYNAELPTVSVVIPFLNDHLSTLMRTVHSVINRSPKHLLREVILVNDHSTTAALYGDLKVYLEENFNGLVHVIDLPVRSGLINARIAGARHATGDVLVFLDSHVEANTNWLPPLLDPIAENYRTCVCPFIDVIDASTYAYRAQDEGARGVFEWNFLYKRIPIRKGDRATKSDPFPSPIMAGGLFAISTKFFWELGGYDPGLDIWGGEQYELSFKIWLCGGQMYDAPCSRIGHIYRHSPFANARNGSDYVTRNFKRVAEVWMDEYKEFLYNRNPGRYSRVDVGDITKQLEVKQRLQCKPFKYFLEEVAPDMVDKYPYYENPVFASGAIESLGVPGKCIDTMGKKKVGLFSCASNKKYPHQSQSFELTYFRDIRLKSDSGICLDGGSSSQLVLFSCHLHQGNQLFRYDLDTKQIKLGKSEYLCMEAQSEEMKVFMERCDVNNEMQQWKFGYTDEENLLNWKTYGSKLL